MLRIFSQAGVLMLATLTTIALSGTNPSGAFAQSLTLLNAVEQPSAPATPSQLSTPANVPADNAPASEAMVSQAVVQSTSGSATSIAPASLDALIAAQPADADITPELKCLATAIFYEAGHERAAGELAVGRVIVARTKSGRFPESYCGVVRQPSQFSFVRGGDIRTPSDSAVWRRAVAVARIADAGSWQSPVEGALFFHAASVRTGWRMQRIAQVDNNVFYH